MLYAVPGDEVVFTRDGLPTGLVGAAEPIALQVQRAENGTVVLGRTTNGIAERPDGSGNYVFILESPVEEDVYSIIADWSSGVFSPSTTAVEELRVTANLPVVPSQLGEIADHTKAYLGGGTFDGLVESQHFGAGFVLRSLTTVKERVLKYPPALDDEGNLHPLVLAYLGKLGALELIPAAFDFWGQQLQTESTGNDSTEVLSYPDRLRMLEKLQEALLRQTRLDEPIVAPLLEVPRLRVAATTGPAIDEEDDFKVTPDPRDFSPPELFPYGGRRREFSGSRSYDRVPRI